MDNERIELMIEGLPEKDGKVLLGTLMSEIQSLSAVLNRLDRDAGDGKSGSAFEVVALSYASPYRIAVEPRPIPNAVFTGPKASLPWTQPPSFFMDFHGAWGA